MAEEESYTLSNDLPETGQKLFNHYAAELLLKNAEIENLQRQVNQLNAQVNQLNEQVKLKTQLLDCNKEFLDELRQELKQLQQELEEAEKPTLVKLWKSIKLRCGL